MSEAAKAYVLGQLSMLILKDEDLVFHSAWPDVGVMRISSDSIPGVIFEVTISQEEA